MYGTYDVKYHLSTLNSTTFSLYAGIGSQQSGAPFAKFDKARVKLGIKNRLKHSQEKLFCPLPGDYLRLCSHISICRYTQEP